MFIVSLYDNIDANEIKISILIQNLLCYVLLCDSFFQLHGNKTAGFQACPILASKEVLKALVAAGSIIICILMKWKQKQRRMHDSTCSHSRPNYSVFYWLSSWISIVSKFLIKIEGWKRKKLLKIEAEFWKWYLHLR